MGYNDPANGNDLQASTFEFVLSLSDHCSAQGGIRMQHSPINRPAISKCSRCGRTKYTLHLVFKQNVSYFFGRKEQQFSGDLCFSCASRTFASVEFRTLFWTWWGIIGFWLGPLYIVHNLVEYIIATFRFVRSKKYVRKGLLRLCVAVGITWIGWLGYKSLDALATTVMITAWAAQDWATTIPPTETIYRPQHSNLF